MQREDLRSIWMIVLLPLVLASPQLAGFLHNDPLLWMGAVSSEYVPGLLRGWPYLDPNAAFGTQALGHRAMLDWLDGVVPWWNYYSGVGLPLAAEYQPGAFFPLTAFMLFPHGMIFLQASLRILTGIGTYGLLRQMGMGRGASLAGGLLYAFNGTLAWHAHAPASAVPFLPWILWGIERAYACARSGEPVGWRLIGFGMALGLACAFPETSYLSGLLALSWAVVRGLQLRGRAMVGFALAVTLGGVAGIALSAPQVYSFLHYLTQAYIGPHAQETAHAAFIWHALASSIATPYLLGPPFGYAENRAVVETIWGGIGGYVTAAVMTVATYGFLRRRDPLAWVLVAWTLIALGKSFGVEPAVTLMNLVPGVKLAAFYRYAPPAWELAIVILAARGIQELASEGSSRSQLWFSATVAATMLGIAAYTAFALWPIFKPVPGLRNSAIASIAWAALTSGAVVWMIATAPSMRRKRIVCGLLVFEAMFMTFIPTLAHPRGGKINQPAIEFLQEHLGLQRFFTLGPIQPNYGAYFGIASINHNYLPVARRWVDWGRAHLDPHMDEVSYVGNFPRRPGEMTEAQALRTNLSAFEWVGVKYVIGNAGAEPLAGVAGVARVYSDSRMTIYELPAPKPYFESENGRCRVHSNGRESAAVTCSAPDRLIRRELFFPGWTATRQGADVEISLHRDLFQSVELPAGASEIRFRYAPPHISWAWLAMALAAASFAWPTITRVRRSAASGRSAS